MLVVYFVCLSQNRNKTKKTHMAKGKVNNKIAAKWKPVEITGSILNGSEDFEGFAGLEVLENYDSSFLKGDSRKNLVSFLMFI